MGKKVESRVAGMVGKARATRGLMGLRITPLALALSLCLVGSAFAQQVPSGATNTTTGVAGNNVPIVNIATPNGNHVSLNTYNQFNVGTNGVILNNSAATTTTQLGGYILGNTNLRSSGSAQVIVNQVTSASPSQLNGYIEVAGQQAAVVVANPNGISCDGCGFINTSRATLTTGVPMLDSEGALSAFRITQGTVAINGGGFNASNLPEVDVWARAVQLNAALYAQNVNLVTGVNQVGYANRAPTVLPAGSAGGSVPQFALDVSALGGMYANKITLVGTEAGVGVNSQGALQAQAGDINLNAQGEVTLGGPISAKGTVAIGALQGVTSSQAATIYGQGAVAISSPAALTLGGVVASGGDVDLQGGSITASNDLLAGIGTNGQWNAAGNLNLASPGAVHASGINGAAGALAMQGASLDLSGAQTQSGGAMSLAASGNLSLTQSTLVAMGPLRLSAEGTLDTRGVNLDGSTWTVSAQSLDNRGGQWAQSGSGPSTIDVAGAFGNTGGVISSNGNLALRVGALDNTGGTLSVVGALAIQSGALANDGSQITAGGSLQINAEALSNTGGVLGAIGNVSLTAASLDNSAGGTLLSQNGALSITTPSPLVNTGGLLQAGQALTVTASDLNNTGGAIKALGHAPLSVNLTGTLTNAQSGLVGSNGALTVSAATLINDVTSTLSGQATTLNLASAYANAGTIQAGTLNLTSAGLTNTGTLSATGAFGLTTTGAVSNRGAMVFGGGLTLDAQGQAVSNTGTIQAQGATIVTAASLTNSGSLIDTDAANSAMTVSLTGALSNTGTLGGTGDVTIGAASLSNTGGGQILSQNGALKLTLMGAADNTGSLLQSGRGLSLSATGLDNTGGKIEALGADTLSLNIAGTANNDQGLIGSNGALVLNVGALTGQGALQSSGNLEFSTAGVFSNSSTWATSGVLTIDSAGLDNGGSLVGGQGVVLTSTGAVTNTGTIQSGGALSVLADGQAISNSGTLAAQGVMTLTAASLTNSGQLVDDDAQNSTTTVSLSGALTNTGTLGGTGDVTVGATSISNQGNGQIVSQTGALGLTASGTVDNTAGGLLQSGTALNLTATSLDNTGGTLTALGSDALSVNVLGLINNGAQGLIGGNGAVNVDAGILINASGSTISGAPLTLNIAGTTTNDGDLQGSTVKLVTAGFTNSGSVVGTQAMSLGSSGAFANTGTIASAGTLALNASGQSLTNRGTISALAALTVSADSLNNSGSLISSPASGGIANAGQTLDLGLTHALTNTGLLGAAGQVTVDAGSLSNSGSGQILSQNDALTITTGALSNTAGGLLQAQNGFNVTAASLDNTGGSLVALGQGALTLNIAGAVTNGASGLIGGNSAVHLTAASLSTGVGSTISGTPLTLTIAGPTTNAGTLEGSTLNVSTAGLTNSGTVAGTQAVNLTSSAALGNTGTLQSGGSLDIQTQGQTLTNSGSVLANGPMAVNVGSLGNAQGTLGSLGDLTLDAASVDNTGGQILSQNGAVHLTTAGALVNATGGLLQSQSTLNVTAASLDNTGGTIQAMGTDALAIHVAGLIDNGAKGLIGGNGAVSLNAGSLTNASGSTISGAPLAVTVTGITSNAGNLEGTTLDLASAELSNSGSIAGSQAVNLTDTGALTNTGMVASNGALNLTATGQTLDNSGTLNAVGALGLQAAALTNSGTVVSGPPSGGSANAGETLDIHLTDALTNTGLLGAAGDVTVTAGSVDNQGAGALLSQNGSLSLTSAGALANTGGGVLQAAQSLGLSAASLDNTGGIIQALGTDALTVKVSGLANNGANGLIGSDGAVSLTAGSLTTGTGSTISGAPLTLAIGGATTNAGTLEGTTLTLSTASLSNSGTLGGTQAVNLTDTGALTNTGSLQANGALDIEAQGQTLTNSGNIAANGPLTLNIANLVNDHGTLVDTDPGDGALSLNLNTLSNRGGTIGNLGDIALTAASIDNTGGKILSQNGALTLTTPGALTNTAGSLLQAQNAFNVTAASLDNTGGSLVALGQGALTLDITGSATNGANGLIGGNGAVNLTAGSLTTGNGSTISGTALSLNVAGTTVNAGTLQGNTLNLTTTGLSNNGTIAGTQAVNLTSSAALGNTGTLQSGGSLDIQAQGQTLTNSGSVLASGPLTLNIANLVNDHGTLVDTGSGALTLNLGTVSNRGGAIGNAGDLTLNAASLDDTDGTILSQNGALTITTGGALTNTTGALLQSQNALSVTAASLDNTGGSIKALGAVPLTLTIAGVLDNGTGGLIASNGSLVLNAGTLNNTGTLYSAQDLNYTTSGVFANVGGWETGGVLTITSAGITNSGTLSGAQGVVLSSTGAIGNIGTIASGSALSLNAAGQTVTNSGTLAAQGGALTLKAGAMDNSGGTLTDTDPAASAMNLTLSGVLTNHGGVLGGSGAVTLSAASLDNTQSGKVIAGSSLNLATTGAIANDTGLIQAGQGGTVQALNLTNGSGKLLQLGTASFGITTTQAVSNGAGGVIGSNGDLGFEVASLDNAGQVTADGVLNVDTVSTGPIGTLTNTGLMQANGTVNLQASALSNTSGGQITAGNGLTVHATSLDNTAGTLANLGASAATINVTGNLVNDHGTLGSLGSLSVDPTSISNQGGQILAGSSGSAGGLTITVSNGGLLNNTGGLLQAYGNLTLDAGSLGNEGGTLKALASQASLTLTTTGAVDNSHAGMIGSAGTLTTTLGSLNNAAGTVQAGSGLSVTSTGAVTNDSGKLLAGGAMTLNAQGQALSNRSGLIQAQGAANLTAASLDNTGGTLADLASAALGLSISGTLTNTGGTLGSGGDLNLTAASLNNSGNGQLVSGGNATLNLASSFNNTGGQVFAKQNLTINAANASVTDTSGGSLAATGNVSLSAASFSSSGGKLVAGNNVSLTSSSWDGGGSISAGNNLTYTLAGNYSGAGLSALQANGLLTFDVSGNFDNTGTLQAAGGVTVNASTITNAAGAIITSGNTSTQGTTTLRASNGLTNVGDIQGTGVVLSGSTVTNTGTVVGQNVQITAGSLVNGRDPGASNTTDGYGEGTLAAGQAMNLNVGSLTNIDATILSLGSLAIGGQSLGTAASSVTNSSGLIETENVNGNAASNTLSIDANTITNQRRVLQVQTTGPTVTFPTGWSAAFTGCTFQATTYSCSGQMGEVLQYPSTTYNGSISVVSQITVQAASQASQIVSGGDLLLSGQTMVNKASTLAAGGNLLVNGASNTSTIQNIGWIPSTLTVAYPFIAGPASSSSCTQVAYVPASNPDIVCINIGQSSGTSTPSGSPLNAIIEANHAIVVNTGTINNTTYANPVYVNAGTGAALNTTQGVNLAGNGVSGQSAGTVASQGQLGSGGGAVASGVTSSGGLSSSTGPGTSGVSGNSPILATYSVTPAALGSAGSIGASSQAPHGPASLSGNNLPAPTATGGHAAYQSSAGGTNGTAVQASLGGYSGNPLGAIGTPNPPGGVVGTGHVSGTATGSGPGVIGPTSHLAQIVGTPATPFPIANLPNGGLYTFNTAPNQPYLIETNPALTNYQSFLTGSYLLNLLNWNGANTLKQVGDGYYEQQLVEQQVVDLTGKPYLGDNTNNEAQYRALMDNGAEVAKQFDLTPGVALTSAQMADLTQDIVWLVNETVDGQQVLVPVVYLAANGKATPDGALIDGQSVLLSASGDVTNSGAIQAQQNLGVAASNILNQGGSLSAGNDLSLAASNNLSNLGGSLSAGHDLSAYAGNDLTNSAQFVDYGYAVGGGLTGGNNLSLTAGHDLTLTGTMLQSGDNTVLQAGNNLTLAAVANSTPSSFAGLPAEVGHTVDSLDAGGDLTALAGHDLVSQGAQFTAGQAITLGAGSNLTLAAVTNTLSQGAYSTQGKTHITTTSVDQTVVGSSLTGGTTVNLFAGHDLTATAAKLTAGGALNLAAGHDLTLNTASEEHDTTYDSTTHRGGFLSSSSTSVHDATQTIDAIGAALSGDTVNLSAGHDLSATAAQIAGTGDVNLLAGHDLAIAAGLDTTAEQYSTTTKKSGLFGGGGASGLGGIGFTIGSQHASASGTSVQQTAVASLVGSTQGDVSAVAGGDLTVVGSDLIAQRASGATSGGNIALQGKNITVTAATQTDQQTSAQSASSHGFTAALVGTPLDGVRNVESTLHEQAGSGKKAEDTLNAIGAMAGDTPGIAVGYGSSSANASAQVTTTTARGSTLNAAGDLTLNATGGDLTVVGSALNASGTATLEAQQNVALLTSVATQSQGNQSSSHDQSFTIAPISWGDIARHLQGGPNHSGVSMSAYNAQSDTGNGTQQIIGETGTTVNAGQINVISRQGDISAEGAQLTVQNALNVLAAQGNIDLGTGEASQSTQSQQSSHQIGDLGGTGYAGTIGVQSTQRAQSSQQTTQSTLRTGLTSTQGDVTVVAKGDLVGQGVDIAGRDVTLQGSNVALLPSVDTAAQTQSSHSSEFGVTVALSGAAVQAAQAADAAVAAHDRGDGRLAALDAAEAAYGAKDSVAAANGQGSASLVKVTVSVGGGSQSSTASTASQADAGSTVTASHNVSIVATGSGATTANGMPADGDILLQGAQVQAGGNVSLTAAHDIDLLASQDTATQSSSNHSSGGSVGVGFALGGQQNGFTLELAAAAAQGKAKGNGTTNELTQVNAGNTLTLASGNDTTLNGAQATGQTVLATVGGNLTLTSTQDSSHYSEQDQSASAGLSLCIPPFCYGSSSASASVSDTSIHNSYQSVTGETGIAAGNGGFQIAVGGTTALTGAALASSADASKNLLDSGNLTVVSLQNSQSDSASQVGATLNTGGALGSNLLSNTAGAALSLAVPQGGNANSTTQSSIAPGTLVVRTDPTQDLSGIDRSATTLDGNGVNNSFDVQQVKENFLLGQAAGYVGMRAAGDIEGEAGLKNGSAGAIALHAAAGAIAASLSGGNAAQGAAGAAAGEAVLNILPNQTNPTLIEAASILTGNLAGGGSGAAAANAGELYNYLTHLQRQQEATQLATCTSPAECQKIQDYWNEVSASQSLAMTASLPVGSYTVDLADVNPQSPGYDALLATAIAQSANSGALNALTAQLDTTQVNEADGEPTMSPLVGPTQAQINAINSALLGPVFGAPGNVTRGLGGSPSQVAAANDFGADVLNVAGATQLEGIKGSGEPTLVSEPLSSQSIDAGIKWGQGIQNQGMPWESYLAGQLPAGTQQLPPNFKTFDFYNPATQTAISAKTLDTMGSSYLSSTTSVYSTLAGYVDSAANFSEYTLKGVPLNSSIIQTRELQVAVPANTTPQQWEQINQAVQYGQGKGVQVIVVPVQ